jgi:outer membrane protein assembly factor BamA
MASKPQFDIGFTVNRQGRPALDCQFSLPKILGTSASVTADASVSSFIAHSFNLKYLLPNLVSGWNFSAEAVKQVNDFQFSSSFSESVAGFSFGLSKANHRFGLDAHLRDIHPLISLVGTKMTASEQIRRVPLRSIKTSANYKYVLDRVVRKTSTSPHPVGGHRFTLYADISGLMGDVRLTKLESSLAFHRRLWKDVVFHSRFGSGAIAQMNSSRQQTPIQDRFFLGGTNEEFSQLRGFAYRSVGPSGKRIVMPGASVKKGDKVYDHLGGDAYFSIDNVVSFPLYEKDGIDVRGMAFLQIGSLVPSLHSRAASEFGNNVRASVGFGVMVPIGNVGSMELTLGRPIYGASKTDTIQSLQIGIRIASSRM